MVSLIDNTTEYFVARVVRSDNTSEEIITCNDWFGLPTIEPPGGLCEVCPQPCHVLLICVANCDQNVMAMDATVGEYPCFQVLGLNKHSRYFNQPAVDGSIAAYRFYAGAPITTAHGVNIGSLFMFDNDPRPNGLNLRERKCKTIIFSLLHTASNTQTRLV